MLRWVLIVILVFVVVELEDQLSGRVSKADDREHIELAIKRGCYTAPTAPAAERCVYAGLRGLR